VNGKKDFFISGSVYDGIDQIFYTIHLDLDPDKANLNLLLDKTVTEISLKSLDRVETYKNMRHKNDSEQKWEDADADTITEYYQ
jgi:hypothetical protein